jgi:hypothetical protein
MNCDLGLIGGCVGHRCSLQENRHKYETLSRAHSRGGDLWARDSVDGKRVVFEIGSVHYYRTVTIGTQSSVGSLIS